MPQLHLLTEDNIKMNEYVSNAVSLDASYNSYITFAFVYDCNVLKLRMQLWA